VYLERCGVALPIYSWYGGLGETPGLAGKHHSRMVKANKNSANVQKYI